MAKARKKYPFKLACPAAEVNAHSNSIRRKLEIEKHQRLDPLCGLLGRGQPQIASQSFDSAPPKRW
jgi:hypothetical protein